ncbi:MAG: ChaN family lipoprotein, partial [Rhodospirillaceae bacterium]|nr:ChaN family lipoprotein [Rhodospirillaceae bacterium]
MFHPPLIIAAFSVFLLVGCAAPPQRTTLPPLPDLTAYLLVDPATDAVLSVEQAAAALADADVVFLGETHRHPGNHLAQMALFRALHTQNADTALSLEQFERDVQPVLDQYLAGDIGEATLRDKGRAWDNYPVSYRPLVEYAKANGLAVIAA